jgi:hypothetical protein
MSKGSRTNLTGPNLGKLSMKIIKSWVWGRVPVILAFRRQGQGDCEFEAIGKTLSQHAHPNPMTIIDAEQKQ